MFDFLPQSIRSTLNYYSKEKTVTKNNDGPFRKIKQTQHQVLKNQQVLIWELSKVKL